METPIAKVGRPSARGFILRDAEAGAHFERFFITAVVTMLVVRAFLALTGYPQLGGRRLQLLL